MSKKWGVCGAAAESAMPELTCVQICPKNGVGVKRETTNTDAWVIKLWKQFEISETTAELARERVQNTQLPLFTLAPEQITMEFPMQENHYDNAG